MKIYKLSDRIKLRIADVELTLAPLTRVQKYDIQSSIFKWESTKEATHLIEGSFKAVKYGVRGISGVHGLDGSEYKLSFDGDVLSDDCVEELLNSELSNEITVSAISLLNGIPKKIINPMTGKELEGVEIVNPD